MNRFSTWLLTICCCLACICTLAQPQEARLEAEYKLSVPADQEEGLWKFLSEQIEQEVQSIDPTISVNSSTEYFIDQYYDNESLVLLENQAGVRHRKRFVADTLSKELVQIKLSFKEGSGVVRQEFKFDHYNKIKLNDRLAAWPLWEHIEPKDRKLVNLRLANFAIEGTDLTESVKVKQRRRRVYLQRNNYPLATITLDRVTNYYFPYPAFTELELELNELLYTDADDNERAKLDELNQKLKSAILDEFPDLKQDQTPKYNKMSAVLSNNQLAKIYDNYVYLLLGAIVFCALALWYRNDFLRNKRLLATN